MIAGNSQQRSSLRTVVQGIIDSQQSRALVQPAAAGRAPLLLRVKGTLMCEHNDYRKVLRVMNSAGGTQAAESFDEYMQVVVGEIVALRDAVLMFFRPDGAESEGNNDHVLLSLWHEGLRSVLAHLGVPWPLGEALECVDIRDFDGLEDDRDAVADIDTWQILHDAMDRLTERCMGNTIDTYRLLGGMHEADGTVETHQDGLCWAVAVEGKFDPDFGKEWDPEYEPPLPVWGPPSDSASGSASGSPSGYMLDYYKPA